MFSRDCGTVLKVGSQNIACDNIGNVNMADNEPDIVLISDSTARNDSTSFGHCVMLYMTGELLKYKNVCIISVLYLCYSIGFNIVNKYALFYIGKKLNLIMHISFLYFRKRRRYYHHLSKVHSKN